MDSGLPHPYFPKTAQPHPSHSLSNTSNLPISPAPLGQHSNDPVCVVHPSSRCPFDEQESEFHLAIFLSMQDPSSARLAMFVCVTWLLVMLQRGRLRSVCRRIGEETEPERLLDVGIAVLTIAGEAVVQAASTSFQRMRTRGMSMVMTRASLVLTRWSKVSACPRETSG